AIAKADPQRQSVPGAGPLTLRVADGTGERVVSSSIAIGRAGVRSGHGIALVERPEGRFDDARDEVHAAAILVVEGGRNAGKQFPLRAGSNFVGRGAGNDV